MGVKLVSASAGSVEIVAPATASNYTATMPAGSGTVAVNGVSGTLVSGTAVASTSGTSIDFTGIPSWVKRITVMFDQISGNGTSPVQVQIGSGSAATSGYLGNVWQGNTSNANLSAGFQLRIDNLAANVHSGMFVLTLLNPSTNTWTGFGSLARTANTDMGIVTGSKSLSGTLDRVRITTVNGTDTFDAGSINILYE